MVVADSLETLSIELKWISSGKSNGENLIASASNTRDKFPVLDLSGTSLNKVNQNALAVIRNESNERSETIKRLKELNGVRGIPYEQKKTGDAGKNKVSVLGFIAPFVSLITTLALTNLFGVGLFWIGPIISIAGIVACIIGLKSKKRGLSVAGLVIGIIFLMLWIGLLSFGISA